MAIQRQRFLPFLIISQCLIWLFIYHVPLDLEWSREKYRLLVHSKYPSNNTESQVNVLIQDLDLPQNVTAVPLPTRPAIIAPRFEDPDYGWIDSFRDGYDVYIYQVDNPSEELPIPANKGNEAMAYLSFIIDHWEQLPTYGVFIHGHQESWHQHDGPMGGLIRDLKIPALQEEGYINFRCTGMFACREENYIHPRPNILGLVDHGTEAYPQIIYGIADAWPQIFDKSEELPESIASYCCAQFAVTREFIQRRDKEVYVRARNWLLNTDMENDYSGRVFEKIWAYLMTGESIVCPTEEHCLCKYFGRRCSNGVNHVVD